MNRQFFFLSIAGIFYAVVNVSAQKNPFSLPNSVLPGINREPGLKKIQIEKKPPGFIYEGFGTIGGNIYAAVLKNKQQKLLKVGDRIDGFKIIEIRKKQLHLVKGDEQFILKIEKK